MAPYRGRVVDFAGDGTLAIFDGAARAIRCALTPRAAARRQGLRFRAAVHRGEVELAEESIHGIAIHEGARMLGLAGSAEILVSEITTSQARDAGTHYQHQGPHELRGLPGSYQLLAVTDATPGG